MGLKKTEQKEYAKFLFTEKSFTQKEIAEKVGVTEKTLRSWISANDNEWKKIKTSLMATKATQIKNYYTQLENLNEQIATRKVIYDIPAYLLKPFKLKDSEGNEYIEYPEYNEGDFPIKIGNVPTSKEADTIVKITNAIQKLEGETSLGETVHTGMAFTEFVRDIDFEKGQEVSEYFDMFIRQMLNNG